MGMYDTLRLPTEYILDVLTANKTTESMLDASLFTMAIARVNNASIETQTKSLDCCLSEYKLEKIDGEFKLIQCIPLGTWVDEPSSIGGMAFNHTGIKEVPQDHTGVINCYGGLYTDDTDYDLELNITFVEGKVVKTDIVKSEIIIGDKVRAVQTANFFSRIDAENKYRNTFTGRFTNLLCHPVYYLGEVIISVANWLHKLSKLMSRLGLKVRMLARKVNLLFFKHD